MLQPQQEPFETQTWRGAFDRHGRMAHLAYASAGGWEEIGFRADEYAGPAWYGEWDGERRVLALQADEALPGMFRHSAAGLDFSLQYQFEEGRLAVVARVANRREVDFRPLCCGLKLGLNTYMVSYPEWDQVYFPTLLRCEKTHFWGYCMTPLGRILGLASPDPVASWSLDYNHAVYGSEWHGGHRIYTLNLDLLHQAPLPARHPQGMDHLAPGEARSWTLYLVPLPALEAVKPALSAACRAPILDCERHTLQNGETARVRVYGGGEQPLRVTGPDGRVTWVEQVCASAEQCDYEFILNSGPGLYTAQVGSETSGLGEATLYVRQPWSWYASKGREAAVAMPQKASTHIESWMGCFSAFLARKHFPNAALDSQAEANFREILPLMFDVEKGEPLIEPGRVQNTAGMIALLTDLYQVTGQLADLELAARLADWLMQSQDETGAYRANYGHGSHYTSVIYLAKYMLELALVEKELGMSDPQWQARYERHYASARAAVDDLQRMGDNIGTEGEHTFEDGMISCTALQLGMFALLQGDPQAQERYARVAQRMVEKHQCLEQRLIPDARMHGGTLRFWEAQYDVLIKSNMMNSPHGWTSWKTYALYYLYLLTGEEWLLREAMDGLGAALQCVDAQSGELRWAFVPDPYVPAQVFVPDADRPGQGQFVDGVIGEQYVDMISRWWRAPANTATGGYWGQGGCCDNDVHEHFKCLEEIALTAAFVVQRESGEVVGWNCIVEQQNGRLRIVPSEAVVNAVHVNLRHAQPVEVQFTAGVFTVNVESGLHWLNEKMVS